MKKKKKTFLAELFSRVFTVDQNLDYNVGSNHARLLTLIPTASKP
jgi:hypothetical protein